MITGSVRVLGILLAATVLSAADSGAVAEAARGAALAHEGKYDLAIQHYKAALRLDAHLPGLRLDLGLAYFKSEQASGGGYRIRRSGKSRRRQFPGPRPARDELLRLQTVRGRGGAVEIGIRGHSPTTWNCGTPWRKVTFVGPKRRMRKANTRILVTKNPDSAPVHILLGEVLDASNRVEDATKEFEAAVKASPVPSETHFGLGYLYWKQQRYEQARQSSKRSWPPSRSTRKP